MMVHGVMVPALRGVSALTWATPERRLNEKGAGATPEPIRSGTGLELDRS